MFQRHVRNACPWSLVSSMACTVVLALAIAPASEVHAQVAEEPLSLLEAVRMAERDAPMITARQAAVSAAESAVDPAGRLPDPELALGIRDLPVTTDDRFSLTQDDFTMRTVGLMQRFPNREKRQFRTQRAQADAERERAMLANERLVTAEAVARAWIVRAGAERRLELIESLRPRSIALAAAASAAIVSGRGTAADGIAARAAQSMLEDRISVVRRELEEAKAELARWLPEADLRPIGAAPDFSELKVNPDALLSNIAHHRELLAFDAAEHAAQTEVALAQAEKRPDWSVEFSYGQRGPSYSNLVSLEFRIGLPVFPGRRQDPTIASKRALAEQVSAERAAASRMHTAALRKTLAGWRSANERARRYEAELLPLGDDRAEATLAAYRGGRVDLQAPLTALNEAVEVRIAYTELLSARGQAWAELHFAFAEER